MIFYEDFIKKIEEAQYEELQLEEIENFGLEKTKKRGGYGIAIPLMLIAAYEIFVAIFMKQYYLILIALVLFYFGLRQCRNMWAYKVVVNTKEKHFFFQKLDLDLHKVEKIQLREAKIGKKVTVVLDFITIEKKQVIIPMYMTNQLRLVRVLQNLVGSKFSIKK